MDGRKNSRPQKYQRKPRGHSSRPPKASTESPSVLVWNPPSLTSVMPQLEDQAKTERAKSGRARSNRRIRHNSARSHDTRTDNRDARRFTNRENHQYQHQAQNFEFLLKTDKFLRYSENMPDNLDDYIIWNIDENVKKLDTCIRGLYEHKLQVLNDYGSDSYDALREKEFIDAELSLTIKRDSSFKSEIQRLSQTMDTELNVKKAYDREFRRLEKPLPFYSFRTDILESLKTNNFLVIQGQTGSGKSTQVPQYLLESGLVQRLVCTQPRKIAAISLAKRISQELLVFDDTIVTWKVGGRPRGNQNIKERLMIMTDKLLLNEYKRDKTLAKYSCVIIDEAHERTLYTDILLCELKKLVEKRSGTKNPLKLIIMSATIDEEKFSAYFNSCPIISVPGVMHRVEVRHEKMRPDYLEHTLARVRTIIENPRENPGDVLVFLPSGDDINKAIRRTNEYLAITHLANQYVPLGLKGSMDAEDQEKLFEKYEGKTKLIYSTNVAEMSVTIDGVRVIVDCGRVKEMVYDQERNISLLKLAMISKSSAIQRKGRAGRTSPGICYRLFERTDYENMEPVLKPEIQRMHLGLVILQAMSCGIQDVLNYDFIDKPDAELLLKAMQKLESLKLISKGHLTQEGKLAAELQLEPSIACILIEAIKNQCQDQVTKIISMMSISSRLFESKMSKQDKSEKMITHSHSDGDFLTYLRLFNQFKSLETFRKKREWCQQNHYVLNSFNIADNFYDELSTTLRKLLESRDYKSALSAGNSSTGSNETSNQKIIESICAGLHPNLAFYNGKLKDGTKVYKIVRLNQEAFIDFSSCLFALGDADANSELLLFSDLFRSDKLYMRNLTPITLDTVRKYSTEDYSSLARQIKKPIQIENVNKFLVQMIDYEWIETLEREISFHVYKKDSAIFADVVQDKIHEAKSAMARSIVAFEVKKIRELYEFRPDGQRNCRVVMGAGFKTECILLSSSEFLRINIDNLELSVSDDELFAAFADKFPKILDWRVFNTTLNPTKSGYVIFGKPADAEKALKEMQNFFLKGKALKMTPSNSIEKRSLLRNNNLIITWHLAEPTGRVYLTMKATEAYGAMLKTRLENDGYAVKQKIDKKDPTNTLLIVHNFRYLQQDENEFIEYYSRYVRFQTCYFERRSISLSVLETPQDLVQIALVSYFEQFGPINGKIDLVPFQASRDGKVNDKCTVYLKYLNPADALKATEQTNGKFISDIIKLDGHSYGFGRVSVKTQYTEEYQLPSKAVDLLRTDINRLKVILNSEYKCQLKIFDKADKYDKISIMLRTHNAEQHDSAIQVANEILKPKILSLGYTQYERVRKLLSANTNQLRDSYQQSYTVFIGLDSRFKQVSIYGSLKSQETVFDKLNSLINESEPAHRVIHIKSFKALLDRNGQVYEDLKQKYKGEFNLDFKKKTLKFSSKDGRMDELEKEINSIQNTFLLKQKKPAGYRFGQVNEKCGICGDQLEDALTLLRCSHKFCTACVKSQFRCTDISMDLACVTCNVDICVLDLRRLADFNEELVNAKASLMLDKEFIRNREYGYCKVCNQISRIERFDANSVLNCLKCKRKYCLNCDKEAHGSTLCKEAAKNSDLFNKYKEKFTKPCPHCKAPIEKNEGCNKMHCIACKKFMCWICQAGFKTQEEAYTHINREHPGQLYEAQAEL